MHPIDVVYTQNLEETVFIVASMTSDLETRAKKGELDFLVALELTEHETKVDNGDIDLTAEELYNYDVPCGQPSDSITISTSLSLKNPTKCLWRWESDRRSNFFIPPAPLCAVTYMTEISSIVTLNNQFNSTTTTTQVR